ncbi:MAG: MFS transporter [Hyphomicrobiales bacterium]|nr:MAG: MFS transporter [Hyphomicrobiales bacterium]
MTTTSNSWRDLFASGGLALFVIIGGTGLQAMEAFIGSAMMPTVVADIGGLELFAWNTTIFIVASILATLFAAVRPRSIGPRGGYLIAAAAFGLGSLLCGLAPSMHLLLGGRFVQGFGAGLLIAQSIAMFRIVFPERLWPRMMALNATVWGVGTLLGPALGGIFAEIGLWRWAFLSIVPAAILLAIGAWRVLPARSESQPPARMPFKQIFLVTAIVLDISVASLLTDAPDIAGALVMLALVGLVLLGLAENYSRARLLPEGAFSLRSPMGGLFALILVLGLTITSDIFAPLFLQRLHGLSPLWAGYMTALVAGGWSIAAIATSGWTGARVRALIATSPVVLLASTVMLAFTLAQPGNSPLILAEIALALLLFGAGIGIAFQHLSTRVLATSTAADNDRTSAGLGMVQLFASGLGAAIGGVAVNAAGLPYAETPSEIAFVAQILFGVFAIIAAIGIPLSLLVIRRDAARALQPAE